ncbi:hypothetical protein FGO68_gene3418 [Halteria grandinella]|uniref:Uncharacterized protein n=1 Tax=Halteria grandinella TaxID=5974 RepID=A0A8J8T0A9_HALGN|nr:hypothetical protein FGO68_gene3418 [Halteria grandinella]
MGFILRICMLWISSIHQMQYMRTIQTAMWQPQHPMWTPLAIHLRKALLNNLITTRQLLSQLKAPLTTMQNSIGQSIQMTIYSREEVW